MDAKIMTESEAMTGKDDQWGWLGCSKGEWKYIGTTVSVLNGHERCNSPGSSG